MSVKRPRPPEKCASSAACISSSQNPVGHCQKKPGRSHLDDHCSTADILGDEVRFGAPPPLIGTDDVPSCSCSHSRVEASQPQQALSEPGLARAALVELRKGNSPALTLMQASLKPVHARARAGVQVANSELKKPEQEQS